MDADHSSFTCSLCGSTFKTKHLLMVHERNSHEHGTEKPKKEKNQYAVWRSSYPVSKETFDKIRAGEMEYTCPNCKKSFANHRFLFRHFAKIKCKKDQSAVEPSPDMAIVIRNGEKVAKMVKGEKHR